MLLPSIGQLRWADADIQQTPRLGHFKAGVEHGLGNGFGAYDLSLQIELRAYVEAVANLQKNTSGCPNNMTQIV